MPEVDPRQADAKKASVKKITFNAYGDKILSNNTEGSISIYQMDAQSKKSRARARGLLLMRSAEAERERADRAAERAERKREAAREAERRERERRRVERFHWRAIE